MISSYKPLLITLSFSLIFGNVLCQEQCSCYIVQGFLEFKSQKVKKKDLEAKVAMIVMEKNQSSRRLPVLAVETNGSLNFGPQKFQKHANDSLVFMEVSTNKDNDLVCLGWYCESKDFSDKGYYGMPPNRIKIPVRDKDRDVLLSTAQDYASKDPRLAINYYKLIDSSNLDRNSLQKYITTIELAGLYKSVKDYYNQAIVFAEMQQKINIDELNTSLQERYWEENYDNKLFMQGLDTLKTKRDKIDFNAGFGNMAFEDNGFLGTWKQFVVNIKKSEFGKAKLQKLDAETFSSAETIMNQKKIIAEALGREEIIK